LCGAGFIVRDEISESRQPHAALAKGADTSDWFPAWRPRANALEEGLAFNGGGLIQPRMAGKTNSPSSNNVSA
jgi:hypothetical protein